MASVFESKANEYKYEVSCRGSVHVMLDGRWAIFPQQQRMAESMRSLDLGFEQLMDGYSPKCLGCNRIIIRDEEKISGYCKYCESLISEQSTHEATHMPWML